MELRHYTNILLKWWWLILASVVVASVSSYLGTRATPPTYIARTTLMVGQALQNPNPTTSEFSTGQVLAQSYADLAKREPVLRATLEALGLEWNWGVLQGMVSTRVIPNTQLLEISVLDTYPQRAKVLADEIAYQLILQTPAATDPEKEAERQFVLTQINDLKVNIQKGQDEMRQLDEVISQANSARQIQDARSRQTALQAQISTWQATYAQLLTNLQEGSRNFLSVVEPAQTPGQPAGPRTAENVMLAAAIGLVLAGGAAFLMEYIDDTIKTPDDVRQVLGLTMLGGILPIEASGYPNKLIVINDPRSPASEAYRMLRTNLQFSAVDRTLQTLMVTSPNPMEGKSLTAANLAITMVQAGKSVILVDADLRRPVQHKIFNMSNNEGLTTLLLNEVNPTTVLRSTQVENLSLLLSGPIPPNPSELLGSKRMEELLEALRKLADIVVVDSPPVLPVADTTILASRLDGTLLVIDSGSTRRAPAKQASEALKAAGAYLPGAALNRLSASNGGYYYYYYQSSDGQRNGRRKQKNNPLEHLLPKSLFGRNGHSDNGADLKVAQEDSGNAYSS